MLRSIALACVSLALAGAPNDEFEIAGKLNSGAAAAVSLFGVSSPFAAYTSSDAAGRFTFKKLAPGTYTLAVFEPEKGEARQTIEVGRGSADARGRILLSLQFRDSDFVFADAARRQHSISAAQLAIPEKAQHEFEAGERSLGRRDVEGAVRHLEEAVRLAPQFATAWNNLGTIAYQTQNYARAEECFREALRADSQSYEPLVNLGGVLLTEHKLDEAWEYNSYAVMTRPNDALANAQMGQTYFQSGNLELALKYLERAREIDPAHFSRPQLFIAEIHLRRGETAAAADALDDFLKHHPDWPQAEKMRAQIAKWRAPI